MTNAEVEQYARVIGNAIAGAQSLEQIAQRVAQLAELTLPTSPRVLATCLGLTLLPKFDFERTPRFSLTRNGVLIYDCATRTTEQNRQIAVGCALFVLRFSDTFPPSMAHALILARMFYAAIALAA